jgi:methionyl aminopeptidase
MNSRQGYVKTQSEIEKIAEGGKLLRDCLYGTAELVRPGVTTAELNDFAEKAMRKAGGRPSFIGYGPKNNLFPAGLCTSINDVVVHGIPSSKDVLKEGDIVGLDIGMQYKGLYTDTAITVPVGKVDPEAEKLIAITKKALDLAIKQALPGNRIGDISFAIQSTVEAAGFNVVRDLVGHGVGYEVHEDPAVPCFGRKGTGELLEAGMVLAIEPMVTVGKSTVVFDHDGWTIRTRDGKLAAHFEHTIAITKNGARILT